MPRTPGRRTPRARRRPPSAVEVAILARARRFVEGACGRAARPLDFTLESVRALDALLPSIAPADAEDLGAYFAESLRRAFGGRFEPEDGSGRGPSLRVGTVRVYPVEKARRAAAEKPPAGPHGPLESFAFILAAKAHRA